MKDYDLIIDILSDKIKEQAGEIIMQKWRIDDLEAKLKKAESHIPTETKTETTIEIR